MLPGNQIFLSVKERKGFKVVLFKLLLLLSLWRKAAIPHVRYHEANTQTRTHTQPGDVIRKTSYRKICWKHWLFKNCFSQCRSLLVIPSTRGYDQKKLVIDWISSCVVQFEFTSALCFSIGMHQFPRHPIKSNQNCQKCPVSSFYVLYCCCVSSGK